MVKRTFLSLLLCALAAAACAEGGVDEEQGAVDPPVAAEIDQTAAELGTAAAAEPVGLTDDPDEGGQIAARDDGRGESASVSWCVDTPWGSTICCSPRSCVSF
ncbi:MAG: hypothetical protein MUF34_29510 [Polyangiaceae bacterium]|jgi:hypothetical protein|nr:hypothetical protein [Polyangiaceae bacterium]